jgi:hypothetical protein
VATVHSLQLRSVIGLPTISYGHCCDLKIETAAGERWWLCRLPPGRTDHRITLEKYNTATNTWEATHVFTDKAQQ